MKISKDIVPVHIKMHLDEIVIAGQGTTDYNNLENKPSINGTTLEGSISLNDIGVVSPTVENETLIFS